MEISRRLLLKLGMLQAGAATLPTLSNAQNLPTRRHGPSILQGATDETRTQFSIVHAATQDLKTWVSDGRGNTWAPDKLEKFTLKDQPTAVTHIYFSNLSYGPTYNLVIQDTYRTLDQREFGMLDTYNPRPRFAICSCMDDARHTPEIWQDLVEQKPDMIFFVGDSTYVDTGGGRDTGATRMWRRFSEARATLEIYFGRKLIPVFATWDDHDFGLNDSGAEYPFVKESQENFLRFFAMDPNYCSALTRGPGVSSSLTIGSQQFLFMDDRSWRIVKGSHERYGHWGQMQEAWALDRLMVNEGMNWMLNGTQFFPQMVFKESFSGDHPVQFDNFARALRKLNRRVAFISGDVHFSEVSQIETEMLGYPTYELTSSSMHSYKMPGLPEIVNNPRRIAAVGEHNYLLVQSTEAGPGCRITVESRSAGGRIHFKLNLEV